MVAMIDIAKDIDINASLPRREMFPHAIYSTYDKDEYYKGIVPFDELETVYIGHEQTDVIKTLISYFDTLSNRSEVIAFLNDNEELVDVLSESLQQIDKAFPNDVSKSLNLLSYKYEGGDDKLVVDIIAADDSDLDDYLDKFDDEWWLSNSNRAKGKILFRV